MAKAAARTRCSLGGEGPGGKSDAGQGLIIKGRVGGMHCFNVRSHAAAGVAQLEAPILT